MQKKKKKKKKKHVPAQVGRNSCYTRKLETIQAREFVCLVYSWISIYVGGLLMDKQARENDD
jgi:hypothetical protein